MCAIGTWGGYPPVGWLPTSTRVVWEPDGHQLLQGGDDTTAGANMLTGRVFEVLLTPEGSVKPPSASWAVRHREL